MMKEWKEEKRWREKGEKKCMGSKGRRIGNEGKKLGGMS